MGGNGEPANGDELTVRAQVYTWKGSGALMTLSQYDWQKLLDSQRLLMHIGLPFDSMVSRSSALLSKSRMLAEKNPEYWSCTCWSLARKRSALCS